MDLLLVKPRDPWQGTSFTRIRTLTLPSVAAAFVGLARTTIVDENVQSLPDPAPFDLVGIGCDSTHAPRAYQLAAHFRAAGRPVIMGGTHPTAMPDEALRHCDAVVQGEVEGLAPDIVEDLSRGQLRARYRLAQRPDLSTVPVPDVNLLPVYQQRFAPYPIELTRGCRHACRFCFNRSIHGPGFRRRPLDPLIEAIRQRPEWLLLCMDDNLMNDPQHLGDFAERVAPLGRRWGGQSTLSIADDPALLRLLRRSGFCFTFVGLESFSRRSLAAEGKSFNEVRRYRDQFRRLRKAGVMAYAGVILGLDGDDPGVFARTERALRQVAPAACAFTLPTPYPGTAFYRQVRAQGRLLCRDLGQYDGHHLVVRPLRMSVEALQRGYHALARRFYGVGPALQRVARNCLRSGRLRPAELAPSVFAINMGYRRFHGGLAKGARRDRASDRPENHEA